MANGPSSFVSAGIGDGTYAVAADAAARCVRGLATAGNGAKMARGHSDFALAQPVVLRPLSIPPNAGCS